MCTFIVPIKNANWPRPLFNKEEFHKIIDIACCYADRYNYQIWLQTTKHYFI